MRVRPLSVLARLTAGALLFQATVPAGLAVKVQVDAALARRRAEADLRAAALRPPKPMKGVPTLFAQKPHPIPSGLSVSRISNSPGRTMLSEGATLIVGIPSVTLSGWQRNLASHLSKTREARLRVQIGEVLIDAHEPAKAQSMFDRAAALLPVQSPDRGLARFDAALSLFLQGRFAEARLAFRHVAASSLHGVNRKRAVAYAREAGACAGYHAAHEAMGIPEPLRLDPLCGVASLAVCLRAHGLPFAEGNLLSKVRHDGEGSDVADLVASLPRLGLMGREIGADEQGLRALPKPVVAHVEHDHFVAVVDADAKGVEYVCSDCGRWPGGPVRLSWKQWSSLSCDGLLAVATLGSAEALALESLPTETGHAAHLLQVSVAPHKPGIVAEAERILAALGTSVIAQGTSLAPHPAKSCGMRGYTGHCTPGSSPPVVTGPGFSLFGTDDPVNVATAEEEYAAPGGLRVYNPVGPSVGWGLQYFSLTDTSVTGFGAGWTHPYNWRIAEGARSGSSQTSYLVLPNTARITLNQSGVAVPTAAAPIRHLPVGAGYPFLVDWCYDTPSGTTYYVVTTKDRTKLAFSRISGSLYCPTRIADRIGNFISLAWSVIAYNTIDGENASFNNPGLTSISDSSGAALLTLSYSGGHVVSATDRYGRKVLYTVSSFTINNAPPGFPQACDELTAISQITTPSANSAPVRAQFDYTHSGNGDTGTGNGGETVPFLAEIAVPSPTGSGMSGAAISYSAIGEVQDSTDANGNRVVYSPIVKNGTAQSNAVRVQFKDPQYNVVYQADYTFDNLMSRASVTNAAGQKVVSWTYADPKDPFAPSTVTDGNNRAWGAKWDAFGNLTSITSPKQTVTTRHFDYTAFALGELQWTQEGNKTSTEYAYDEPSGFVNEIDSPIPDTVGTGARQATHVNHDGLGNVTSVTRPGNDSVSSHIVSYGYTTDGSYSQPEALGEPLTITDSLGKVWHRRYDARRNVTATWDPYGYESDAQYDLADQPTVTSSPATGWVGPQAPTALPTYLYLGGPVSQVNYLDENGTPIRYVSYGYGAEGELLSRLGSVETAVLTYDAAYHPKTLTDGNNHKTVYGYDLSGRPSSIGYPLASGVLYDQVQFTSYDAVGNLLGRLDGNGQLTSFGYGDGDGLLSSVGHQGTNGASSDTSSNYTIHYDAYDRPDSGTDGTGSSTTTYDDRNVVTAATRTYGNLPAKGFSYTHYPDGSRKTMTNPAGTWTYGYDANGRYTSMTSPAGTSGATYFDNGWQSSRAIPGNVVSYYGFTPGGDGTFVRSYAGGGATPLADFEATGFNGAYDLTGLRSTLTGSAAAFGGSTSYGYDGMDRLTGVSSTAVGGYSQSYNYDLAGNLTKNRGETSGFSFNADNQWLRADVQSTYDGDGNPTVYNFSQTYDAENRLTGVSTGGGPVFSAGYRSDGLRGWTASGGPASARTYFLYDRGEPVVELDAGGNVTATNVFAPDGLVARGTPSGGFHGYVFDLQGSVAERVDPSGIVQSAASFDAYGRNLAEGGPSDPFGYDARQGYYRDATQVYYCRHRYYDPLGRWLTRDPIGVAGGINLYAYCGGNPVGSADPSGLSDAPAVAAELAAMAADAAGDAAGEAAADAAAAAAEGGEGAAGAGAGSGGGGISGGTAAKAAGVAGGAALPLLTGGNPNAMGLSEFAEYCSAFAEEVGADLSPEEILPALQKGAEAIGRAAGESGTMSWGRFGSPVWGAAPRATQTAGQIVDWGLRFDAAHDFRIGRALEEYGWHINPFIGKGESPPIEVPLGRPLLPPGIQ